jgi:hypothetical protein
MLFARNVTGPLSSLLKNFDQAVAKNKAADMRSFAVFLTDDGEAAEGKLKELADTARISENVPLTIVEDLAGPSPYKLHKEAEVTVLLYTKGKVVSNFAFKPGEFEEKHVKAIVAELPKILPSEEELRKEAEKRREIEEIRKKLEAAKKKDAEKK